MADPLPQTSSPPKPASSNLTVIDDDGARDGTDLCHGCDTKLPQAPQPSPLRLILTLGIAGSLSGLLLVTVFLATAPAIERNRIEALERAALDVLPGAERFEVFVEQDGRVVRHDPSLGSPSGTTVYAGFDGDGEPIGFAIPGSGPGFQDTLEILIGWDPFRRRVIGMAVLETRETPGLGDKIITDPDFTASFESLSVEPTAVLVGPGARSEENEVDGISGATISAQAIVNIVNDSVSAWDQRLPDLTTESEQSKDTTRERPEQAQ